MTRIVQCLSHSIEAHDQLQLYTELGYEAVDIGGYIDPRSPHDPKRPPVEGAPFVPEIKEAVDALGTDDNLGSAQSYIPNSVLDWLGDDGVLIYHHNLQRLWGQWAHIKDWLRGSGGRRVIWRTVGQSVAGDEWQAQPFRRDGLEIIRYSPKEANIPNYAGSDALIRFWKDPVEWSGWTGEEPTVLNISQHADQPHGRDGWLNWGFWEEATEGLPKVFAGPHTEKVGGLGQLSLEDMQAWLRKARVYLYTGTQPASYTLGLLEAGMTGIPIVSIGPAHMTFFPYGPLMFEGHEFAAHWENDPARARKMLVDHLENPTRDSDCYRHQVAQMEQFTKAKVAEAWRAFLGAPAAARKAA